MSNLNYILMINRKRIEIIQRFSHSVLIKYVKSGKEASVSTSCIRKHKIKQKPEKEVKHKTVNNQLKINL